MRFSMPREIFVAAALAALMFVVLDGNALAQTDWKKEWEKTLSEARKEGRIVVGIPARPELRKELELIFKPKFGIDMDLSVARGPQNASRIASRSEERRVGKECRL